MTTKPTTTLTPARQWYAGLPAPAQSAAWRDQVEVRRYTGTPQTIEQPALVETVLCLHLGGAKQVRRTSEGHSSDHLVEPGALTLMPAGQVNRWVTHGPIDYAHLVLDTSLLDAVAMEDFDRDPRRVELCSSVGLREPWLEQLFRQILATLSGRPSPTSLHAESLLVALVATLLRDHSSLRELGRRPSALARGGLAPWRLRRVDDYMAAHLTQDIALKELTALTGLSRAQFFRAFRQSTGLSPAKHLLELRLERAQALLAQDDLDEDEIGRQVGLGDRFAAAFRRRYGVSPRMYRLATA